MSLSTGAIQIRFILKDKTSFLWSATQIYFSQRRYRYKPKWAMQLKASTNCQRALDYFDAFYKPVYGDLWPSIRLSLMSLPKHCAIVNKFSDVDKVYKKLERAGSLNILKYMRDEYSVIQNKSIDNVDNYAFEKINMNEETDLLSHSDLGLSSHKEVSCVAHTSELTYILDGEHLEPYDEEQYKDNLNVFVPPETKITEKEKLMEEEFQMSSFQPSNFNVDTVPMDPVNLPSDLNGFIYPKGDVSKFSQSKIFNQVSGYYLMDAASFMPILALNLSPSDHVLDLCAAPGGKSFLITQVLDLESGGLLHCNDSSHSRVSRLKNVFKSYLPPSVAKDIIVTQRDGLTFENPSFDKVLVDVPCNTDRHVVTEDENNLFKPSRTYERLQMMKKQTELLISGIKSCAVGGSVVYSTCTLAFAQNDGVIQAAIESLAENSQITVAVQDLSPMASAFNNTFTFFNKCRYGQLIIPSLSQNFGPMYFAKLQRIK